MNKFKSFTGIVVHLDQSNIDTDALIPKQFLKSVHRTGFGPNLFDEWRYLDHGEPGKDCSKRPVNPDFILNNPPYDRAEILLSRSNFGCGSSREHAPWALMDFGIKVILAESFADIFYNNCFKNGILPIRLPKTTIDKLFDTASEQIGFTLIISLEDQIITSSEIDSISFEIDQNRKNNLLKGLDEIGITLGKKTLIEQFEENHRKKYPWIFQEIEQS